jgi:hypothetical protein
VGGYIGSVRDNVVSPAGLHVFVTDDAAQRLAVSVFDGFELIRPSSSAGVLRYFSAHGNYVVQELERSTAVGPVAEYFDQGTGLSTRAAAYVSRTDASVLPRHADDAHVLAAQLWGQKSFTLFDDSGGADDVLLQPGDALFIPQGVEHVAVAVSDSLHVCVAMRDR